MPKSSLYNHFQRWNEAYYIAYNARSGAVALMTPEHHAVYQKLLGKLGQGEAASLDAAETELLGQLKYGGFVLEDDEDELSRLRFPHNLARYASDGLALIIAPTMACNMACEYCFEQNKSGRMSTELMDRLVDFVDRRGRALRQLIVTWYGGEPLLAMDIIEQLTARFLELGAKHQFDYGGSIVTNGYLLTPQTVDKLCELKVRSGQVTLDGPAVIHNRKRPLKNGQDSFASILENLKHALTKMTVSIRVNVDQSFTVETIDQLLGELTAAGLREKVALNFGHLQPSTKACANIAESCFETRAFSRVEAEFCQLLLQRGFSIYKLPAPKIVCCMAQITNAFVVDPQGELYRCWNYVGDPARSMGNIKDPLDFQHPNFQRLFAVDPFEHELCRRCNLLPICMGGCPSRRMDLGLPEHHVCDSWKYNLEPMLEIIAAAKLREQPKTAKEPS